jgi:hypothetical protein
VEKLRKALEKKAAVFQFRKQNTADIVNDFQFAFGFGGDSILKMDGPFAGGMEDTNQLHRIATHAIRNYVRCSWDH